MNDFEAQTTPFVLESGDPDFIIDDSAIAIKFGDELSIITGCSHSGIVNIVEYACKVTGINKLKMVIGGFHLKEQNRQTIKTVEYFEEKSPEILIPSHCTDLPALALFQSKFGCSLLKTGMEIHF
jgi:7,8-dihydropterin-6-yl-methyl-4-(beta-D-ribofuranosyl)aminobenzene 5'-phosphate synthase